MKNITSFLAIVAIAFSCTETPEEKAHKLIEDSLQKSMNDWSSYEPIEFGPLDSTFSVLSNSKEYQILNDQLNKYLYLSKEKMELSDITNDILQSQSYMNEAKEFIDKADSIDKVIKELSNNFKEEFNGLKMKHSFRGKNALGAKVKNTNMFYFDKDLTKVTEYQQKEE